MSLKVKLIKHLKQVKIFSPVGEIENEDTLVKYGCAYHGGRLQGTAGELLKKDSPCEQCTFLLNKAHVFNLNGKPYDSPKIKEISMFWLGKFDYSKMMVTDTNTKGIITCPSHGEFSASLIEHVRDFNMRGCPKCADESQRLRGAETRPAMEPTADTENWFSRAKDLLSSEK